MGYKATYEQRGVELFCIYSRHRRKSAINQTYRTYPL